MKLKKRKHGENAFSFRFFLFISIEHLQRSQHHSVAAHCQLLRDLKNGNIIVTSFNGVAYSSNYVNDFVMVMWEWHSIPRHTHIHYHHFISVWLRFTHYFTFHRIKKKQTKCVPYVNVNDQPCTCTDGAPSGLPTDNVHASIKLARNIDFRMWAKGKFHEFHSVLSTISS